jgi:O-antigen ligase
MPTTIRPTVSAESKSFAGTRAVRGDRRAGRLLPLAVGAGGLLLGLGAAGVEWAGIPLLAVLVAGGAALESPGLGLAVFALVAPFQLVIHAGPLQVSTVWAMLAILTALLLVALVTRRIRWRRNPLDLPVLLFAAASGLSMFGLSGHFDALAIALGACLLYLISSRSLASVRDVVLVVVAVAAGCLVQAGGIALAVVSGGHPVSEATRVSGLLIDPNHFAGELAMVTPLLLALAMLAPRRWLAVVASLAAVAFCIAIVATLSRSGWLGLLAGLLVLGVMLPGRRLQLGALVVAAAAAVLLAGLVPAISVRLGPHAMGPLEMLASRWRVWSAAIAMTWDHPIVGVGIGDFANVYPAYGIRPLSAQHAHNLFLNLAAERGALGLAAFGLVLAVLGRALHRAWAAAMTDTGRALVAGFSAGLTAFLVHSLFDVSYVEDTVLLLFWLVAGTGAILARVVATAGSRGLLEVASW